MYYIEGSLKDPLNSAPKIGQAGFFILRFLSFINNFHKAVSL